MICPKCGASISNGISTCSVCGGEIDTLAINPPTYGKLESTKPKKEIKKGGSYDGVGAAPDERGKPVSDGTVSAGGVAVAVADSASRTKPKGASTVSAADDLSSDIESLLGTASTSPKGVEGDSKGVEASADDIEALLGISSGKAADEKPSEDTEVSADDIEALLGITSEKAADEKPSDGTVASAEDIDALLGTATSDKPSEKTDGGVEASADDIEALLGGTPMQSDRNASDSRAAYKKSTGTGGSAPSPNKITGKSDTSAAPKRSTGTSTAAGTDTASAPKKTTVSSGGTSSSGKIHGGGNLGTVNPIRGIIASVKGIFNFYGRSSRSEFCWGMPFLFAIVYLITANTNMGFIATIAVIATMIAMTSLSVRRLHDIGKSWVGLWKLLIPYIGMVWLLFQLIFTPSEGKNRWGKDNH